MYTVYKILNDKTGKVYFGSTGNFLRRCSQHKTLLKHGKHHSFILQKEYSFYGKSFFSFHKVEEFPLLEDALTLEQVLIDSCDALLMYNVSKYSRAGDNVSYHPLRSKITEQIKNSLILRSQSMSKQEKLKIWARYGQENFNYKGREKDKICKCGKSKCAYSSLCRLCDFKTRCGQGNSFYGKHHSEETKLKIGDKIKKLNIQPKNIKPVIVDGIYFESVTSAAKSLNIGAALVLFRIKSKNKRFKGYFYA